MGYVSISREQKKCDGRKCFTTQIRVAICGHSITHVEFRFFSLSLRPSCVFPKEKALKTPREGKRVRSPPADTHVYHLLFPSGRGRAGPGCRPRGVGGPVSRPAPLLPRGPAAPNQRRGRAAHGAGHGEGSSFSRCGASVAPKVFFRGERKGAGRI